MITDRSAGGSAATDDPSRWRADLLAALLRWIMVIGIVVAVPSVVLAVRVGEPVVVLLDVAALAAVIALATVRPIPYTVRATTFIVFVYALGAGLLTVLGIVGQLYLLAVPVVAVVLLGKRAATASLVVTVATVAVAGLLSSFRSSGELDTEGERIGEAVVVALNFALVGAVLTLSTGNLIRRLERSLERQRGIARSLVAEQASLRAANADLVVEMAERQRVEAEVRRLAMAIEQSTEVVLIAEADGHVVYANRAHRDLVDRLGPTAGPESLDRFRTVADAGTGGLVLADAAWSGTILIDDRRGVEHRFAAQVSPLADADGTITHHVAALRDVTDELRMRERLRRSERLEALGTFASGTAHDFNNVTAAIQMVAELTRDGSDDPAVVEHMDVIIAACNRAADVVRQMTSFGRPATLERRPVRLRDVVDEAVVLLRATVAPTVEVRTELLDDGVVDANPAELQQIVMNLAQNAADAMTTDEGAAGTLTIAVRAGIADATSDAEVVLDVTDTGAGIEAGDVERIFDPFFTTKEPGRGSGLGLSSVHGLVTSLGGTVVVESAPGDGATFRVSLPRSDSAGPDERGAERDGAAEPARRASQRIMFVEDERSIREIAVRFLTGRGYEVVPAFDGVDAIERFEADPSFDVVVTDLAMPRLDGRGLVARLRAVRPDVRVVVSSGFGELDDDERSGLGVDAVVAKPYALSRLAATIAEVAAAPR